MDFLPDPLSYRLGLVHFQSSCSVVGTPDFEAGSHTLLVSALRRTSAHPAQLGHAPGPGTLTQNRPAIEQVWQSEP